MAIRWLDRELPELVGKGILAQETADRLRQYYGEIKSHSKTAVILGTIGALLIGLGIILLLAHNWEQFSRLTRTILSLAPLVIGQGLALWVLWKKPQSGAFKESTATFLSLMVGASIALITQTYNISSSTDTFILTWMLLIAPIIYLMKASLPAAIYFIGITAWAGSHWHHLPQAILFWPLAAITIPHFIWAIRQEIYAIRTALLSLIMMICVSVAAAFSLGTTWDESWIVILPAMYSIFYFLGWLKVDQMTPHWQGPLRFIGSIGLFILAFYFTFRSAWQSLSNSSHRIHGDLSNISVIADHIITLSIIATAVLLFYRNMKRRNWIVSMFGAVPLLAIVSYFIGQQSAVIPILIFNVYLFVLSISFIILGTRSNKLRMMNTGMLMLAILILARFFDSDIHFIIKGLAFIIVGIGFLVTNGLFARRMESAK